MRIINLLGYLLVFASLPPLVIHSQEPLPIAAQINFSHEDQQPVFNTFPSYDQILQLLHSIESEQLPPEALDTTKTWLAFLAQEGAFTSDDPSELAEDIADLFDEDQASVRPIVYTFDAETVLCKDKKPSNWKKVRRFVRHHKTAIIVGAVLIVATGVTVAIIVSSSAAGTVASTAAAVGAGATASDPVPKTSPSPPDPIQIMMAPMTMMMNEAPTLKVILDQQITTFKDQIALEPLSPPSRGISYEDQGRILGSLLAHESIENIYAQLPSSPSLLQEIQNMAPMASPFPNVPNSSVGWDHLAIDQQFATDYSSWYTPSQPPSNLGFLMHQIRAETALERGYYQQAVHDFDAALNFDPTYPWSYLGRGAAHFELGRYEQSIEDYRQFTMHAQPSLPLSVPEFSLGFAKGLPKGIYDSSSGLFLFLSDLIQHPINTGSQIYESFTLLSELVRSEEWSALSEALAPEVGQLIKDWDSLPSDRRGELAGYVFGKYGTDILVPGAIAKVIAKGTKSAQTLGMAYRNLQAAEKTLVLETASAIGPNSNIKAIIQTNKESIALGEELGFGSHEIVQLKKTGNLENTLQITREMVMQDPTLRASWELHHKALQSLQPYLKAPLPEEVAKALLQSVGIPTFPRPKGIPADYLVMIAENASGLVYLHPHNNHTSIRIMSGKIHSPNPSQRNPYVVQQIDGHCRDKFGNIVPGKSPEAHIPIEEFVIWKKP